MTNPLPSSLIRPFSPLRTDAERLLAWNAWEVLQWTEAVRRRRLSLLSLEPTIARAVTAAIATLPDVRCLP